MTVIVNAARTKTTSPSLSAADAPLDSAGFGIFAGGAGVVVFLVTVILIAVFVARAKCRGYGLGWSGLQLAVRFRCIAATS